MISPIVAALEYNTINEYTTTPSSDSSPVVIVVWLIGVALVVASLWRVFTKAGRPGWAAIVPIYNSLQLIWMAGKPWWWLLLLCIPFVNLIFMFIIYRRVAQAFGKGVGFTVLLFLLPFIGLPMLAWGNATYHPSQPKQA